MCTWIVVVWGCKDRKQNKLTSDHFVVGLPDELNEDIWTKRLMDWLYFPQMDHRESGVKEAHKATFRWALQPREDMNMPGPNLAEWLQNGDGLFWIQGKLGSGKSTLMKYLWQNPLLDQQLRVWAGSRPLYRASFFFWKMGASELQRSLQGLYRTLLSHLIEGEKKLARIAFPRWRTRDADYEATASVLRNALFRILRVSAFPRKYCFFIDGLDEYEEKNPGMQIELANDILSLADIPGIKIVAASRPEVSFMNRFDACPTLKLQDLTANDIKAYVEDEMRPKMRPMQLTVEHRQELSLLATKVVRKAEGVFLWVALVVADIVIGIDQIESYAELHEKLDQMHDDLYTIFKQILLDRIMPNHRQEVARNLLIAHYMPARQHGPISVHAIGQEMGTDPGSAHPDPFDVAETANKALHLSMRLPVRSRALCSVSSPFSHVDLIHSSMYEFLEGEEIQGILQDLAGNFNVYLAISIGMMARMMEVATDYFPSARRKSLNEEAVDLSNSLLLYIEKGMFRSGVLPRYTIECLIRMQEKEWKRFPDFPCLHETLRHTIGGGLTHYLQYQTESLRQLPRTEDRPLLCYALSMRTLHLRAFRDEELDRESIRLGFARVGPLEMLLQHGASPNEVYEEEAVGGDTYGESTPWTDALYLVKNQVDFWYSRSREGLKMFLHALTSAQYMLRYGADPNLGLGGSGISTQIFVDILRKECCPSKSLAECSCCWARDLKPRVTELVKLVEERRLER